ncbi:MAG: DNA double-strand break repair nuclease NurA [Candidatus Helarchaeota archaeon]
MDIQNFFLKLDEIVEQISKIEKQRNEFNKVLKSVKDIIDLRVLPPNLTKNLWGNKLYEEVKSASLRGLKIAGIDGGLISKSYHGLDIVIIRAVAAIFNYGKIKPMVKYYPSDYQFPIIKTSFDPFTNIESELFANLERINSEIDISLGVLNEQPDIILLDGSILPQLRERTGLKASLSNKYNKIVKKYERLFDECTDRNIFLAGCIKDTRSSHFIKIFIQLLPILIKKYPELRDILNSDYNYRKLLAQNRDSDFLFRFLDVGERSLIFDYHDFANKLPRVFSIFNDYWVDKIKIFYLKSVPFDLPSRIEVLVPESNKENIIKMCDQIASIILPISNQHIEFGVPSVLIEADARAKMNETDIDIVYNSLFDKLGKKSPLLFKLRRNRRPF